MIESHTDPDNAWSDAAQQITPSILIQLMKELKIRNLSVNQEDYLKKLEELRTKIDLADNDILDILGDRMKISDDIYRVKSTQAKAWFMNTKNTIKSIKDKKSGKWMVNPKMFEKFINQGVRIYAFTAAKLTLTYTHECISNILNAAGVRVD